MSQFTNRERAMQLVDFGSMKYGKLMPTDLDGLFDAKGKAWVIIEAKMHRKPLPFGQRLALERLADDLSNVKPTVAVVVEHTHSIDEDIEIGKCVVREYRLDGQWHKPEQPTTLRLFVDKILSEWEVKL